MLIIRPYEYNLGLPCVMSFHLVSHLPRLVMTVAKFLMCEGKVSNLIDLFFLNVATVWLQSVCFVYFFICN